ASANGIIYIKPAISDNSQFEQFKQKYSEKYSKSPDFIAAQAYDGFRLMAVALGKCGGDRDTTCIKNSLYSIKDFDAVIGSKISFDINGDIQNRALDVMTIKDGQFVKL
ncbi:MAG: ABC transporter substrate-binding protein, partial [Patescibacteria group bacterium]